MLENHRFKKVLCNECCSLGYPLEEVEELIRYALSLSRRRELSFHYALNKKELLSICMETIFVVYNDLRDLESKDRLNIIKWNMKNRVITRS